MTLEQLCNLHAESFVHILSLHDKEAEEHTRRVAALILELARAYGIPKSEFSHLYRGALLHDIGKINIPRDVLLKKGDLADNERALVNKHPVYAYELLHPIPHFRQSLSIPYCHHEKWDGSGYPCGLKGKSIPLEARLFAIVDVWDALISNRPYRLAWTEKQANDYIYEQIGKHFDPNAANVFLNTLLCLNMPVQFREQDTVPVNCFMHRNVIEQCC
jgi:HD-GYP domain-containing protein (c-di-GMP phosphodiesterase class II)